MGNEVNFESIKNNGYTNYLQYRGEKFKSGISYDYMDKLNEFVDSGIFVDKNGDGFTKAEKKALEAELFKIHQEHGYSTNFKSMLPGTKTEYNYNDFVRLANAAGYVLKEQEPKATVVEKKKEAPKEEVKKEPKIEEKKQEKPVETTTTKDNIDNTNNTNNNEESVIVEFETTTVTDSEGNVIDRKSISKVTPQFGAIAKKTVTEPDRISQIAKADTPTPASEEAKAITKAPKETVQETQAAVNKVENTNKEGNKTNEEQIQEEINAKFDAQSAQERLNKINERQFELKQEKQSLEQTTETYKTKGFLGMFKKTKTRELSQEEIAANQERINEINKEIDANERYKVYSKNVEKDKFWAGKYAQQDLVDKEGNVVASYPTYDRVIVTNNKGEKQKVAKVSTYNNETFKYDYKYYSLDVQKVGNPKYSSGTYYSVVPDLNNELTDIKE